MRRKRAHRLFCRLAAVPGGGDLNVGLNVHLGRGPLGRVAGKKASNTDPTYIKKTKTRLYNAKNPCGIENGMENWFVGIWRSPTRILGGTNLEATGTGRRQAGLLRPPGGRRRTCAH